MLDIRFIRENPDAVKENIKKKFQEEKLPLVDQVIELDRRNRDAMTEANNLRAARNTLSKQVGVLMGQAKKDPSKLEEAEAAKAQVKANADRLAELEQLEALSLLSQAELLYYTGSPTDAASALQNLIDQDDLVQALDEAQNERLAALEDALRQGGYLESEEN